MNKVFKSSRDREAVLCIYDKLLKESGLNLISKTVATDPRPA